MISKSNEITPNFTTKQAETAEARLTELVEHGQFLGITATSIELTNNEIIEVTEMEYIYRQFGIDHYIVLRLTPKLVSFLEKE